MNIVLYNTNLQILEGESENEGRTWFNFYVHIVDGQRIFDVGQYIQDQKLLDKWHKNRGKDKKIINEKKIIVDEMR